SRWDLATRKRIGHRVSLPPGEEFEAFRPDGEAVLTASSNRTLRLRAVDDGRLLGQPVGPAALEAAPVFSPDGRLVLTRNEKTARLWDLAAGRPVGDPLHHEIASRDEEPCDKVRPEFPCTSGLFSPDGKCLPAGGTDHCVRI